ncbi:MULTISPECIES: FtsX-like permease family protein [unclassified Paenibacillus]|uniref:FtsX-like permease family protein n=1 Tax=unclassified Paenibacillus TaxID=185978 RepID=UPI000955B67A|nr:MULTISPECIES: FtsX-like permease family protein [unclassified Paenibacillus]ASS65516.1 FtsX-like permease family protein [Paenibacillus sp. RUD330]SIQ33530.1 ABC-type transport system, involved in lipoprotein release, permease component [Paenibacillus sp. RU4X]SIQ55189.1 ABC-type transport system, involved in lipoprotein release, permease component [Paenibacillus sp. RU4T]
MLAKGLSWRIGLLYLRRLKRQTLLSLLAGAIGAMLISMSCFHYIAVKGSGDAWVRAHFGPIDWVLMPKQGKPFSGEQAGTLRTELESMPGVRYRSLPVVAGATTLFASARQDAEVKSLQQVQLLGLDPQRAKLFDEGQAALWRTGLPSGQAILDRETAGRLGLEAGDAVWAADAAGERKPLIVRDVVEATGVTGYRGDRGSRNGTVLMNEIDAAALAGSPEGSYSLVLVGRTDPADSVLGMNYSNKMNELTETRLVKYEALSRAGGEMVTIVLAISLTAVFSSAFLLRQIVHMMAESRSELYGVLRAIGMNRRQVRGLFAAEALLLGLLSGLIGLLSGAAAGWGMVKLLYGGGYGHAVSSTGIPITASIPPSMAAAAAAAVLLYQSLIVLLASRKAGAGTIVAALRGGATEGGKESRGWKKAAGAAALPVMAAAFLAAHLYQAFMWEPAAVSGATMLALLVVWLGASASAVYAVFGLLLGAGRRLAGRLGLSMLLAVRYAGRRPGRTFTVMLLFGIAMMTVTFTAGLSSLILKNMNTEHTVQTMLGYGGYVPYQSEKEKEIVLELLRTDEELSRTVTGHAAVEPVMSGVQLEGTGSRFSQAFVPVSQELLAGGGWKLAERSPEFGSDAEAWNKVEADDGYVVLPLRYRKTADDKPSSFYGSEAAYAAGDFIRMGFYKNNLVGSRDKPDLTVELKIAGFAAENSESSIRTEYVYSTTYVSPGLFAKLKPYHHRWPNQSHQGLLLLQFDYRDLELDREISSRLVSGGASSAGIPYLTGSEKYAENRQLVNGFIGFTVLSAVIGLLGLAVLQKRSIGERSREIAMLRCAGVPPRKLFRSFLLEGTLLGGCGLLAGTAAGATGAHAFIRILQSDLRPGETPADIAFPWLLLSGVLGLLLAAAFLFNIGPARGALIPPPTEPLRSADV